MGEDFDWARVERTALAEGLTDASGRLAGPTVGPTSRARPRASRRGSGQLGLGLSEGRRWAYVPAAPEPRPDPGGRALPDALGHGLSFREMRLNRPDLGTGFVGLKHYVALINDPIFWLSLRNTAVWVDGCDRRRTSARARRGAGAQPQPARLPSCSPCSSCCPGSCPTSWPATCGR